MHHFEYSATAAPSPAEEGTSRRYYPPRIMNRRYQDPDRIGPCFWLIAFAVVLIATSAILIILNENQSFFGALEQSNNNDISSGGGGHDEKAEGSDGSSSTAIKSCESFIQCRTDRLNNRDPLYAGQAICAKKNPYMLAMTDEGILEWRDCANNKTYVIFESGTTTDAYFVLQEDASWNVFDKKTDELLWKKECLQPVKLSPNCLWDPHMDCPYLHLHKPGSVILNYIDDGGDWISKNVQRSSLYDSLFGDV